MPRPSVSSKVNQIQSLLTKTENDFPHLSVEDQNRVSAELEHIASQLIDCLKVDSRQHKPQENLRSDSGHRRKHPQEIDENKSWLGLALQRSRSGAWKWDLIQNTVQCSSELYELLGLDPATGISDPQIFFGMLHPDNRNKVRGEIDEAIERGGPFYIEFRLLNKDGRTIWLSSAGTVEHDQSGLPIQAVGINQDITEHKQTEEALHVSKEVERANAAELQALMDAVPAIIWISRDPQCREMVGNRYGYEFLHMWQGANVSKTASVVDLVQQPYRNLKNGQEIPNEQLPMQIAASTGEGTSNYEFDVVFINGVTKNLLGNVLPLTDQNGKPSGAVGAFVDITERKQMENELRRSEARLRMWKNYVYFWNQATNSFFWLLEPDGSYKDPILTNTGISRKSLDQTQGWKWIEIVHPEEREKTRTQWQNSVEQQTAFEVESRVWHEASQQYRWFSHRAVPLIEEETLTGWVGASIDIQEHKEAEQALRDSEQRFRVALASAPMAVFTIDRDLRYTWFYNPHHDFPQEEMVGKRDDEILTPEDAAELIQLKRSAIENGRAIQQEIKIKMNDTWFYFVVALDPIVNERGQVSGLIGAALNVTKQRQLETLRQEHEIHLATQQHLLKTREDERIKIARDIHDGPLQTLIALTFDIHHLKAAMTDQSVKAELIPMSLSLKNAVQELREVVNELRPPTLVDFGLVKAIQDYAKDFREKFPEIELTIDLNEVINDFDLSEEKSLTLYRICQESLRNVIRHANATKVVLHFMLEQDQLILVIQDNGMGFSLTKDFTELLADKHYGLAGMRERAEAVGGTLQVSSKPGKGTEIRVSVPI